MDAAAHPAGVVGDHAADAGDLGARRVGAEPAAVAGEAPVDAAEHGAGLDPHARARRPRRRRLEVAAAVEEDAVGLRLAVQARAAGAEHERRAGAPRDAPSRRRPPRRRAGSRPPRDRAVAGSRRRRSGSGRRRGARAPSVAERAAQRRQRARAACRPRPSRARRRAPGAAPASRPGGSGAIRSMPACRQHRHAQSSHMPLAQRDLHEPRAVLRGDRLGSASVSSSAPCDLARGHAVAARDRGDVEAGEVEPGQPAAPARIRRTT